MASKFRPLIPLLKAMCITKVVSTVIFILYLNKIRALTDSGWLLQHHAILAVSALLQ